MARLLASVVLLLGVLMLADERVEAAPPLVEGDSIAKNFQFADGKSLPAVKIHYTTLGHPTRDAKGVVTNAVLLLHATGGSGSSFLEPQFADELFTPGGLLDPARYYLIMPDSIGHGKSLKPSDGLRAHFPRYDYDDTVRAQYQLLTEHLRVNHLRLIVGTSMGCMQGFTWGEAHPDFMDAMLLLACLPVQIAGRNRVLRKMIMDAIQNDPAWKGGDYEKQPREALRTTSDLFVIAGSVPLRMQRDLPTRDAADAYVRAADNNIELMDANDILYQVDASRNYDPSAKLATIAARVMWVNSADDFVNPPELGIAESKVKDMRNARFVLIPSGDQKHGHDSYSWATVWRQYLDDLLKDSAK